MAQDRPSADNLIETVRAFLETLLPRLEGDDRFKTLVSVHLLGIVGRELRDGPGFDRAELERLQELLGREGELAELNAELARKIRDGSLDERAEAVFAHVLQSVEDKLRIVRPDRLERK